MKRLNRYSDGSQEFEQFGSVRSLVEFSYGETLTGEEEEEEEEDEMRKKRELVTLEERKTGSTGTII